MARYIKKQSSVNTEELSETGASIENESLGDLILEKPVILDEMKTDEGSEIVLEEGNYKKVVYTLDSKQLLQTLNDEASKTEVNTTIEVNIATPKTNEINVFIDDELINELNQKEYELNINEEEIAVIDKDCDCSIESPIKVSDQYATLEQREIGSPILDENGEPMIWPRSLPFFAQEVLDLGFELPKTFGFAVVPNVVCRVVDPIRGGGRARTVPGIHVDQQGQFVIVLPTLQHHVEGIRVPGDE